MAHPRGRSAGAGLHLPGAPLEAGQARGSGAPLPLLRHASRLARNGEHAADVGGDALELTSFVQPDGDGWMQHRPMTWSRVVTIADCEVYELDFRATPLQDVPVRVLEVIDGNVRLQLLTDDPQVAGALNAGMVDFGVFEMSGVPGALLTGTQLVANQLVSA